METFAFLLHPLSIDDVAKKYKIAKKISPKIVEKVLRRKRPFVISEITGVRSKLGREAEGWFIVVPLLPWQILDLDEDYVIKKITKACEKGRKEGAKIVGLGAFTAMVGNGGEKIAECSSIPVTTGNTYTTTTAIEGTKKAASLMEMELEKSSLAVVGATGSIGGACAEILAPEVGELRLVGRNQKRLEGIKDKLTNLARGDILLSPLTKMEETIREADIIITVTGATNALIYPEHIKPGAILCDVARPRDVSEAVVKVREDVLVIDGGIVTVPGKVNFNFDFGLPPGMAEGCISETIILALEERYENYTLGKKIEVDKVREMKELADKHGFKLAGLRREERIITPEQIEKVKEKAKAKVKARAEAKAKRR